MTLPSTAPLQEQNGQVSGQQKLPEGYKMLHTEITEAWHISSLASRLREADKQEIKATSDLDAFTGLSRSVASSPISISIMEGEVPIALYGSVPDEENSALVWLLASNDLQRHSKQFLRESRNYVSKLHRESNADLLWNLTDKRNTVHHKWLKWCGFSFIREVTWGAYNMPFYEFGRFENV